MKYLLVVDCIEFDYPNELIEQDSETTDWEIKTINYEYEDLLRLARATSIIYYDFSGRKRRKVKNRDRQYMLKDWFERLGDEYERLSEERDGEGCN